LTLCERTEDYPDEDPLNKEVEELIKIISKIIVSSKNKFMN